MRTTKIRAIVRKTIGSGGSLLITLPKHFCKSNGLEPGDELALIYNGELLIKPNPVRTAAQIEALQENSQTEA